MHRFTLDDLLAKQAVTERAYFEFLRVPALSGGIYQLRAGQRDPQQPHTEDEVYYVLQGRGRFRAGNEDEPVGPGTILFVPKEVDHRFHAISEDLTILVFFAPAEGALGRR